MYKFQYSLVDSRWLILLMYRVFTLHTRERDTRKIKRCRIVSTGVHPNGEARGEPKKKKGEWAYPPTHARVRVETHTHVSDPETRLPYPSHTHHWPRMHDRASLWTFSKIKLSLFSACHVTFGIKRARYIEESNRGCLDKSRARAILEKVTCKPS